MKQCITLEQLHEISPKQKKRLRKWLLDNDYHPDSYGNYEHFESGYFLDIGQMIEFLGDDYFHALSEYGSVDWVKHEDVCDVLWEAVKEIL